MSDMDRVSFLRLLAAGTTIPLFGQSEKPDEKTANLLNRFISRLSSQPYPEGGASKLSEQLTSEVMKVYHGSSGGSVMSNFMSYKSSDGDTLMLAGSKNRSQISRDVIVEALLPFCSAKDLNQQDANGNTALMNILDQEKLSHRAATLLVRANGANLAIKNNEGKNAIDIVREKHPKEVSLQEELQNTLKQNNTKRTPPDKGRYW